MGLILAGLGSASGVLSDQWKEYFYCDSLTQDTLVVKGKKRSSKHSANYGDDNIISNGSTIAVADGQCMIIVEQGKVVDICSQPGEYIYDMSSEPSVFVGNLSEAVKSVFKNIGKRFEYGGQAPNDERVYFINIKEIVGNKYGTPNAVPFRVVDKNCNLDMDVGMRCFGEYSYKITNPMLFYTNVCANVKDSFTRDTIDAQLKTELLTALQPAFAKISASGVRYSEIPGHTLEIADALNEQLSAKWKDLRGIEIVSFGISSISADPEDEKMIKQIQRNAAFKDPLMAAANLAGAQAQAVTDAANNPNGAAQAFMGVNMAANAGGINASELYSMANNNGAWYCPNCGAKCAGNFCSACGTKKPN